MATQVDFPMLSINPCKMSQVDSNNAGSLANVWGVFHKCSQSLEDGHRLENMSWRLLSRKTIRNDSPSHSTISTCSATTHSQLADRSLHAASLSDRRPQPSTVPTTLDNSFVESTSPPLSPSRSPPTLSLERMVSSIQEKKQIEPLSPSITEALPKISPSVRLAPTEPTTSSIKQSSHRSSESSMSTAPPSEYESERSTRPSVGSDTSAEALSCRSNSHSVVRGFTPGQSPSYRSSTHLATGESLAKMVGRSRAESVKKNNGFMLGGSSGEDESSFDERMQSQPQQSSLTAGLKKPNVGAKKLSFRDVVESRRLGNKSVEDEEVFESDSEDEDSEADSEVEEEEDEEEWEDDGSEDEENTLFQRVDSKPNLVSRRSLLTSMMNEEDRAQQFQEQAMQQQTGALRRSKTLANVITQPESSSTSSPPTSGLATAAKPIMRTKSDIFSLVSSPKTTRRNMLSTEIDENLRRSILHERMQKKSTLNAYTKRVQSARNLTTLPIHSERDERLQPDTNDYYRHGSNLYHEVGW